MCNYNKVKPVSSDFIGFLDLKLLVIYSVCMRSQNINSSYKTKQNYLAVTECNYLYKHCA